jgi:uncharacterized protein
MVGLRRPPTAETVAVEPPAPAPISSPGGANWGARRGRRWQITLAGVVALAGLVSPWAIGPEPVDQAPPTPMFQSDPLPPRASAVPTAADTDAADMQGFVHAQLLPPPIVPVLLPSTPPAPPSEQQAWRRNAVAVADPQGRPMIAIVIDDLGLDRRNADRVVQLPAPLTLSFMTYADDLTVQTRAAHAAGHELLVHVPMEPISRAEDMGPNGLSVGLGRDEVLRRLRWNLDRFDGYVGINNHMGSRFTADSGSMMPVMQELRTRGLLFLDSRTIGNSAGIELAQRFDVPHAARDVFLDNEVNGAAIAAQLAEVETIARRHGSAIAIGHPHDATLEELSSWLAALESKGFVLVPVSTIVRERWHADAASG